MTEEELLADFETEFNRLKNLTVTYEDMLVYIENLQSSVLINVEKIDINISSISPIIKTNFGGVEQTTPVILSTTTEQGKKITTESPLGDVIVTHTISPQRVYTITSGDEQQGLFETS